MTSEDVISYLMFMINAYQNLIDNDIRSGKAIGKDFDGEWKSEETLADSYGVLIEALEKAIKAVEQEIKWRDNRGISIEEFEEAMNVLQEPKTDGDCISRQAAIDAVHQEFDECIVWDESGKYTADEVERVLDSVPPVNPQEPKAEGKDTDVPTKQEPKTGDWEAEKKGTFGIFYRCSRCHGLYHTKTDYCPNCGLKMESEGTE